MRIAHRGSCASPDAIFGSHKYPQRQKAASFNLDEVLRKMQEPTHS
jgi:hypothetical protein